MPKIQDPFTQQPEVVEVKQPAEQSLIDKAAEVAGNAAETAADITMAVASGLAENAGTAVVAVLEVGVGVIGSLFDGL